MRGRGSNSDTLGFDRKIATFNREIGTTVGETDTHHENAGPRNSTPIKANFICVVTVPLRGARELGREAVGISILDTQIVHSGIF